jgi:hypothetical protein
MIRLTIILFENWHPCPSWHVGRHVRKTPQVRRLLCVHAADPHPAQQKSTLADVQPRLVSCSQQAW